MAHHGHQVARPRVPVEDVVRLPVDAAIDGVDQGIAPARLWMLEKRRADDALAGRREGDVDGVVHAAGHDHFDRRIPRPPPEDVRGAGHERGLPQPLAGLLRERALGPVDPAVRTEIRPVQIVGAPGQRLALVPLLTLVGDAITVGVGQLPDARRRGDIERTVEPHRALGQHHPVGKDDARIEAAVAVLVFEAHDAMRAIGELLLHPVVRARGVRDIQAALVVEVRDDGTVHERRAGDALDREAGRHGQLRA